MDSIQILGIVAVVGIVLTTGFIILERLKKLKGIRIPVTKNVRFSNRK